MTNPTNPTTTQSSGTAGPTSATAATASATTPAYTIPMRGLVDLPIRGTKGAPRKFKGHPSDVEQFLSHYEKLCNRHAVTSDDDKIKGITQYCSRAVKEFMKGLGLF